MSNSNMTATAAAVAGLSHPSPTSFLSSPHDQLLSHSPYHFNQGPVSSHFQQQLAAAHSHHGHSGIGNHLMHPTASGNSSSSSHSYHPHHYLGLDWQTSFLSSSLLSDITFPKELSIGSCSRNSSPQNIMHSGNAGINSNIMNSDFMTSAHHQHSLLVDDDDIVDEECEEEDVEEEEEDAVVVGNGDHQHNSNNSIPDDLSHCFR